MDFSGLEDLRALWEHTKNELYIRERECYLLKERLMYLEKAIATFDSVVDVERNTLPKYLSVSYSREESEDRNSNVQNTFVRSQPDVTARLGSRGSLRAAPSTKPERSKFAGNFPKPTIHKHVQLLPEYQDKTITDNVYDFLENNPNVEIHINSIVRTLYGEIEDKSDFVVAQNRVSQVLGKGVKRKFWRRVKNKMGFYIYDLKED